MILTTCSDHGIAIIAKILKTIFDMILIIGPIIAMVSLAYLFFRVVTSVDADKNEVYKKRIRNVVKALLIVVFLPIFVNLIMNMTFMKDTFQIAQCFSEAKGVSFSKGSSNYIKKKDSGKQKTGTMIIDPSKYSGIDGDPNGTGTDYTSNVTSGNRDAQVQGAISWAVKIAADDSFNYGKKPYASKCGCYFCGTNGRKAKAAKGHSDGTPPAGKTWDKTYVCVTFINAAYAHGANDPIFLKYCKKGSTALDGGCRVSPSLKRLGSRVTNLGKPSYSNLQAGDILFIEGRHVAMYIGNGKYVEATSGHGPWSADSIAVRKFTKKNYSSYTNVLRYNGY
ncbi:MAG: C40 family peptidase [Bacilli bacterium]|nr:C40 family peptidase [Bacilli bacterium]